MVHGVVHPKNYAQGLEFCYVLLYVDITYKLLVISMILGQSYNCVCISEATLKDMGKGITQIICSCMYSKCKTKPNMTNCNIATIQSQHVLRAWLSCIFQRFNPKIFMNILNKYMCYKKHKFKPFVCLEANTGVWFITCICMVIKTYDDNKMKLGEVTIIIVLSTCMIIIGKAKSFLFSTDNIILLH